MSILRWPSMRCPWSAARASLKPFRFRYFLVFVCVGFRSGDLGFCHLICFGVRSIFGVGFGLFCSVACVWFDNFLHGFAYECICSVFYFVCWWKVFNFLASVCWFLSDNSLINGFYLLIVSLCCSDVRHCLYSQGDSANRVDWVLSNLHVHGFCNGFLIASYL